MDALPTLRASSTPWVVSDAKNDPRALANPLIAADNGFAFYAGAPLTTPDGHNLGTLCILDRRPRELSDSDREMLTELAGIVMDELELRLNARHTRELRVKAQAARHARGG